MYEDGMVAVHGLPAWRGQAHHAEDRLQCRRSCVKSEAVAKRNEQLVRKSSESTTTFIYFYSFGKHHAHEHTRARGGRTCMTTYMNFSAQADAVMRAVNEGRAIRSAHGLASGQSNHNSQNPASASTCGRYSHVHHADMLIVPRSVRIETLFHLPLKQSYPSN